MTLRISLSKQPLEDDPDNEARAILERYRWPGKQVRCPLCGARRLYQEKRKGQPGFYRCPALHAPAAQGISDKPYVFTVRSGTILESSRMSLSKWLYCLTHVGRSRGSRGESVMTLAAAIDVTRKTAARQLELLIVLDEHFWEKNHQYEATSDLAQWARDKFFKQPDQNEFLFRYRYEKAQERRLKYIAEEEAKQAARSRNRFMLSSLSLPTKRSR